MTVTQTALRPDQRTQLDRAREVLAAVTTYEPIEMAGRIGALQWHLDELLRLVGQLTGEA